MEIVKKNAKNTGFFDVSRYAVSDFRNFIRKASGRDIYDLVFVDPPYAMECCQDTLLRLAEAGIIIPGAIVVTESGTENINIEAAEALGYENIKSTHYGKKTFVNIFLYRGR